MTYTLTANPNTIVRDSDQAFIPTDPDNVDYQDYLVWLDEGNTPNPYVPPAPSPEAAIADSAQSLELQNAKSLAAQGRTDEALAALITYVEANP